MYEDQKARQAGQGGNEANLKQERRGPLILIAGIILVYGFLWNLQVIFRWFGFQFEPEGPPSVMIWNWVAVIGAIAFIFFVERRSLDSIGLRKPTGRDILWAIVFWLAALVLTNIVHSLAPPPPSPGLDLMLSLSIPVLLGIIVTASITEEVIYRGYLIERLRNLTGHLWIGATISFVLFVVPHVTFFGPMWIIYHSHTAILIYALYLWRRNLWSCMILHLMYNLLILLPALGIE